MMNKLLSIALLGTALSLTACGGESDSSGSSEPIQFQGLSDCEIIGNNIIVKSFRGSCLVKKPNINDGKTFSLSCQDLTIPGGPLNARFSIRTTEDADIKSIENDIQTFNKYSYTCSR